MSVFSVIVGIAFLFAALLPGAYGSGSCTFQFGFAALAQQIPGQVGVCLDDERNDPSGGDDIQHTSKGLLVWRKADNVSAFTNGQWTWLLGPDGLEQRSNSRRFSWEQNAQHLAIAAPSGPLLPGHRIVAFYGNPLVPAMGVLGEGAPDQMLTHLQQQAAAYAAADPKTPVQPALELIATVAQGSAGPDGMYRARMAPAVIDQVLGWANSKGYLLILDIQPGRSTVADEVQPLLPYLQQSNVELALDPEFAMHGDNVPGQTYGSIDATAINQTIQALGSLVAAHHLPPKVLIVHRFRQDMVSNSGAIRPSPLVQVVMDMDGFGSTAEKLASYSSYIRDQPVQFAGVKLFYQQDRPIFTPQQALGMTPTPFVVIYQ
jgi:hypothetical protein